MPQTLDDRLAVPQWSAAGDAFPDQAAWSAFFDAINDNVALDAQGTRATRPAAVAANRGLYHFATDGIPATGTTKALSRSDGAAWYDVALLAARADFSAGATFADAGAAQATSAYAPVGVTRPNVAANQAHIAMAKDGGQRWALGIGDAAGLIAGVPDATKAIPSPLLRLTTAGALQVTGTSHDFGANAMGGTGTKLSVGSFADASNAYAIAGGSASPVGLILRGSGATATVRLQPDGSTTALTASATALTAGVPSSLTTLTTSGLATLASLTVTGAASLATLSTSGLATLASLSVTGTSGHTGAATFASTVAVTGALTAGSVSSTTTVAATTQVSGATFLSTGLATLASLSVTGTSSHGALATFAAGMQVSGSPSGYNDEIKFGNAATGAIAALSSFSLGGAQMAFDFRAPGNTGAWYFRNGTNASVSRLTITTNGDLNPTGSFNLASGQSILDASTGQRMLYHTTGAGGALYMGSIDGTRTLYLRGAGVDKLILSASEVNVNSANLTMGTTYSAYLGFLRAQGDNNYIGYGSSGAAGVMLNVYAPAGSTNDVWMRTMDQSGGLGVVPFRFRSSVSSFYDAPGNEQARIGQESDLFSLDTSLFLRWRNGSGTTFGITQVRLVTGANIRTGVADASYFLKVS